MTGDPPVPPWRGDIAGLVYAVQFDEQPAEAVDRLVELIIATDVFPETPERYRESIDAALGGPVKLAELVPQPHSEGALRAMLVGLRQRLEQWLEHDPGFTTLPVDQWRPSRAAQVVAHLEREPQVLSRWLGVEFHRVAEDQLDVQLAVLRLSSGDVVALIQVVGNPTPGTTLFQAARQPADQVLTRFLADTGLPRGIVGWVTGASVDLS